MSAPGLILAAPASGSGKTVVTMGLLRALRRRGQRVAAAKSGPDYIDPGFHEAASGRPCLNLDPWAMRAATIASVAADLDAGADLILCEGAMGLFDGINAQGKGSCADLAEASGWPVVLVVDVAGQAASVAALVAGFARHRSRVRVAGVIFNRVGGARHAAMLDAAVAAATPEIARLGAIPRDPRLSLPERHLGLVQARERTDLDTSMDAIADCIEAAVDLDALTALAQAAQLDIRAAGHAPLPPLGQRIAIARDDAFAFAYPAVLAGWRAAGAEIASFSPLADEAPDRAADAVYLPGGYPELHAGRLAESGSFLAGLHAAAARDAVIYGECGGYMALGRALADADGCVHRMAGLLPIATSFATRRLSLGYREVRLITSNPLGPAGTRYRGHEFHYAAVTDEHGSDALFDATDASDQVIGPVGRRAGSVMGSFIHLIDRAM